jgi:hypothetical protein
MDFIRVAERALPAALCDELISTFESHPGKVQGITGRGVALDKKSSIDLTLEQHPDLRELRRKLLAVAINDLARYFVQYPFAGSLTPVLTDPRTGRATELTMANAHELGEEQVRHLILKLFRCGTINIQKYARGAGGYPHWHSEIWPDDACESLHRIVFWMYYLNDVDEGGETEFWFQQRKVQPRKGMGVIAPAGFTHTHRGNVPRSGDKYIVTSWLLYNRGGRVGEG